MKQVYNIDMEAEGQHTKTLSALPPADIVITMGCGVQCPYLPSERREDWGLEDPTGKEDAVFLRTMAEIREKVLKLKKEIEEEK